ncbi:serine hydrolase [Candidatus Parcubacteria bacterium]|nr:serine hydrolase [Patescibacteria group bacterium]MCG2689076.1 serine hydrolase [Candidatus Parcubacteria bacterium]
MKKKSPARPFAKIFVFSLFLLGLLFVAPSPTFLSSSNLLTEEDFILKKGAVAGASATTVSTLNNNQTPAPLITATSAIAVNAKTGKPLYEKNPDAPLPPASTTKIVTALVILENYDLAQVVAIPPTCVGLDEPTVGFFANDQVTIESLLYGMLVKSASDAACSLAHVSASYGEFINKMNTKAQDLGLTSTVFSNEIGFDSEDQNQLTTARDLSVLAQEAMKNDIFRIIVGTREIKVTTNLFKKTYTITTTNELLKEIPGTTGIKTGNTEKAKGCLVYSYDNLGKKILIVILGSDDRFGDAKNILDWILLL